MKQWWAKGISVNGKEIGNSQNPQVMAWHLQSKWGRKGKKVTGCFLDGVRLSSTLLLHHNGETYSPTSCTAQFSTLKNRKGDFVFRHCGGISSLNALKGKAIKGGCAKPTKGIFVFSKVWNNGSYKYTKSCRGILSLVCDNLFWLLITRLILQMTNE